MKGHFRTSRLLTALTLALLLAGGVARPVSASFTQDTDWEGGDWTLGNGDVIAGTHTNVGHLWIPDGVTVSVQPYNPDGGQFGRVAIFAQSAAIEGSLTADGAGYPKDTGPGAPSHRRAGGSYGGRGGVPWDGTPREPYGDWHAPVDLGSGGGTYGGDGGSGGGAIRLSVSGLLTVDGTLSAHGGSGVSNGGGGSGGSVWLKAGTLAGSGFVGADGGPTGNVATGGGGGGGRIAFHAHQNYFAGIVRASGQPSLNPGRSGTFNFPFSAGVDLVIEADIALPPGTNWTFRSLRIPADAIFEVQSKPGDESPYAATEQVSRVRILRDLIIESEGALSADGLGYRMLEGDGGGTGRSGAGFGGKGGVGQSGTPGSPYATPETPTRLGSGGGTTGGQGGFGGGALWLEVDGILTVDGKLSVDGGIGTSRAGGGSGGGILIKAARVRGGGEISAGGGNASDPLYGGGGGGGRMLIDHGMVDRFESQPERVEIDLDPETLPVSLEFSGKISLGGGTGGLNDGDPGSLLIRHLPIPPVGTIFMIR